MSSDFTFPNSEPPPSFYLSNAKAGGQIFLFTDMKPVTFSYESNPHTQGLQGLNVPYRSQGYGNGKTLNVQGMINAWYAFFVGGVPASAVRSGDSPDKGAYEDILALETLLEEYGPSPLFLVHRPLKPTYKAMLTQFSYELPMSQSNVLGGTEVYPSSIGVALTLVEVLDLYVKVS